MTQSKNKNTRLLNLAFVAVGAAILIFLLRAPEETTSFLPHDENHEPFMAMKKKEAEQHCESCHNPEGEAPLPEGHPPKYRCLFCHKRN